MTFVKILFFDISGDAVEPEASHSRRFNGITKDSFYEFLKERAWRFNGGNHKALLIELKSWYQHEINQPSFLQSPDFFTVAHRFLYSVMREADLKSIVGCLLPYIS